MLKNVQFFHKGTWLSKQIYCLDITLQKGEMHSTIKMVNDMWKWKKKLHISEDLTSAMYLHRIQSSNKCWNMTCWKTKYSLQMNLCIDSCSVDVSNWYVLAILCAGNHQCSCLAIAIYVIMLSLDIKRSVSIVGELSVIYMYVVIVSPYLPLNWSYFVSWPELFPGPGYLTLSFISNSHI